MATQRGQELWDVTVATCVWADFLLLRRLPNTGPLPVLAKDRLLALRRRVTPAEIAVAHAEVAAASEG